MELSGHKTWKDNENANGKRPTSITVHLLRDGVVIETRTVTAGTDWSYSFGSLPADDGYGNEYTYTLSEDGVEGYYSRIDGMNVTNGLAEVPPEGDVPNVPELPERKTDTPPPDFEQFTDMELEDLFDMFGYGTPLYGMFGTGDTVPAWVWICGSCGLLALALAMLLGKKKRRIN